MGKSNKHPGGRPRMARGVKKEHLVQVKLTGDQIALVDLAVTADHDSSRANWARRMIMIAAELSPQERAGRQVGPIDGSPAATRRRAG